MVYRDGSAGVDVHRHNQRRRFRHSPDCKVGGNMNAPIRKRFDDMPAAQQAGILCNDPRFQEFAAQRCGFPGGQFSSTAAAEYLRDCCGIQSRRWLNTDETARRKFQTLRTEFDAWTGKIASQQ